jgi:DnaD/phage-associated family protein
MTDVQLVKPKKLYFQTRDGGVEFRSEKKPGEVRTPNYVYDLWTPLLGATVIGIYDILCRLKRGSKLHMSIAEMAKSCGVGKPVLNNALSLLAKCGFIEVAKPTTKAEFRKGVKTCITFLTAPQKVSKALIEELAPDGDYQPLAPWLMEDCDEVQTDLESKPTRSKSTLYGFDLDLVRGLFRASTGSISHPLHYIESSLLKPLYAAPAVVIAVSQLYPVVEASNEGQDRAAAAAAEHAEKQIDADVKASIFKLYERNIGMLTPIISEEIEDWIKSYPTSWIEDAIKEAAVSSGKTCKYVARILERWQRDGKGGLKSPSPVSAQPPPQAVATISGLIPVPSPLPIGDPNEPIQMRRFGVPKEAGNVGA